MESETILERVRDRYRLCKSYSDKGSVTLSVTADTNRKLIKFETYFLRPSHVLFVCQSFNKDDSVRNKSILWSDGEHTRVQYRGTTEACASLEAALPAMEGATLGLASIHLPLLITKAKFSSLGSHWFKLDDLTYIGDDEVDSKPCYVMQDLVKTSVEKKLWIAQDDFSIRKEHIDFFEIGETSAMRDKQLIEREQLLAAKLGRQAVLPEPVEHVDVHRITTYKFEEQRFDPELSMDVFEFPSASD